MAELVIGPATEVVKCIAVPIKRLFNYLYYFNANIQNLKDEAKRLDDAKEGLQRQVDAAKRNIDDIVPEVETWLGKANEIQENYSSGIEPAIQNVLKSGCLAIKSRFSLSRKATKMAADMKKLHDDCGKFGQISTPAPAAAMSSIPFGQAYELKSRKDFEDDIMTTLREKQVRLMGLYGMGGVGKTTMAKKIMTRAREEGLFEEIVIAVVSQPVDKSRVQKELAELLDFDLKFDSLLARAQRLRDRLMNSKSILIILDDLWEGLDLEEVGIPKECTILLTSRDRDVFRAMNVDKTFQVETLDKEEAWCLFKEKVGACANDQSLIPIAHEIVRECNGLPIAIVNVGGALKDKMNKSIWKDAMQELRSSNPQDIPDFLAQVYNPLKLSYDLLPSEPAKSIFLLCCLFPEDYNIFTSDLCPYAWGLGIFVGKRRLQDARNKMQTLVEMLKSRSLLLDGHNELYVKMHDVVRDVGIFIAAKEGLMWAREESNNTINCSWISLFGADKITLPEGSVIPNLRFLLIERPSHHYQERLGENLFESTRKLCVLSIEGYKGMRSLPHTIQLQKNMRTLILYYCNSLEDITVVGELVSLEILRCRSCHEVKELPVEIGRLNQLKLLDISYCRKIKTIAAGVISRLIRLEELMLIDSFSKWELAVEEGGNAALCELNLLSRLTTLEIQIDDTSLIAEQIHLPNLVEFSITFGNSTCINNFGRHMELELKRGVIIGDWIHQLLRSTKSLVLKGEEGSSELLPLLPHFQSLKELHIWNVKFEKTTTMFPLLKSLRLKFDDDNEVERTEAGSGKLEVLMVNNCDNISLFSPSIARNLVDLVNLKTLYINFCCEMVKVVEDKDDNENERFPFTSLEELELEDLPKLKDFCYWRCTLQLPSLKQVLISNCPVMERFLRGSFSSDSFQNLESIRLESCSMLEHLILWNEEENGNDINRRITFPKLGELVLRDLPRLTSLCKGIQSIGFPLLTKMEIKNCPNMKNLISTVENEAKCSGAIERGADDSLPLFYKSEVGFGMLKVLTVELCANIKSLFSPSIAVNLINLKELFIKSCCEMEKVIEDKDDNEIERSPFINLKVLHLENLPKLKNFCDWKCALQLPSLIHVFISKCPLMERFSCGSFSSNSFQDLESITIEFCLTLEQVILWNEEEGGKDINRHITFPKLDKLLLHGLPRLTSLCKGIQSIEFPQFFKMEIDNCPNMKNLISTTGNEKKSAGAINHGADDSLYLFCKSEVAFGKLTFLEVKNFDNIKSLFSSSIAENLFFLKELIIKSCGEMVKVIEDDNEVERSPFINLEKLELENLPKLKFFCDRVCALQLPSMVQVLISKCPLMESFSFVNSPNSSDSFKDLKSIKIESCLMLEQVILWNEKESGKDINGQSSRCITFPKLGELVLRDLPRLTSFCIGIQSIEFPILTHMEIKNCPNMKNLVCTAENYRKCPGALNRDVDDSLHLFCRSEAAFCRLEELTIDGSHSALWCNQIPIEFYTKLGYLNVSNCDNMKSLFLPSIAENLVNLKELIIESCGEMVKVIEGDEDKNSLFVKLEKLCLTKLPKLKFFCVWRCDLELTALKMVKVSECPEMDKFSFGKFYAPNLDYYRRNGKQIIGDERLE